MCSGARSSCESVATSSSRAHRRLCLGARDPSEREPVLRDCEAHRAFEIVRAKRALHEEVRRARFERARHDLALARTGQHDHRTRVARATRATQHLEPVVRVEAQVEQARVEGLLGFGGLAEPRERLLTGRDALERPTRQRARHRAEEHEVVVVVLHEEDAQRAAHHVSGSSTSSIQ